jgi:sodium-coupled neutral amino acid transporter 11
VSDLNEFCVTFEAKVTMILEPDPCLGRDINSKDQLPRKRTRLVSTPGDHRVRFTPILTPQAECFHDRRMAKARTSSLRRDGGHSDDPTNEEDRGLLSGNSSDDEDIVVYPGASSPPTEPHTPRTPNRVRFDLPPSLNNDDASDSSPPPYNDPGRRESRPQIFVPLLTDIEAPSVTLAASPWGNAGDVHEWAERERQRPRSGLRSAFMNMANSIIGAGIIGQPYAFRQAGLVTGIILLIVLTITVDWTIRLIVINSKLSGSNSFQGTVQHCFGKTGLIAISVAQWAFAFGGMVAFGIIVGDSIPHVLAAIWPGLEDMPVLGLLADRRAVIVVFILGVSYPLSLYRDIAKVKKRS